MSVNIDVLPGGTLDVEVKSTQIAITAPEPPVIQVVVTGPFYTGPRLTAGTTPPLNPVENDIWVDTN